MIALNKPTKISAIVLALVCFNFFFSAQADVPIICEAVPIAIPCAISFLILKNFKIECPKTPPKTPVKTTTQLVISW